MAYGSAGEDQWMRVFPPVAKIKARAFGEKKDDRTRQAKGGHGIITEKQGVLYERIQRWLALVRCALVLGTLSGDSCG